MQKDTDLARSMPMSNYIADFTSRTIKMIDEVDGMSHNDKETHDQKRTEIMKAYKNRMVRFRNEVVLSNAYKVIESIERCLCDAQIFSTPPLREGA
jgi:very-short-patch-repair endonuclease